jgi:hypothetical protein
MKSIYLLKKILVIAVIILLIGITIAPGLTFNLVEASNENCSIEVTTKALGNTGYENSKVILTNQQYNELEQYLFDFKEKINMTTTRKEAIPLFKEAIVKLNYYGLLPNGMNISQAQNLVTGKEILNDNKNAFGFGPLFNLIYAEAFMDFSGPFSVILPIGFPFFIFLIPASLFGFIGAIDFAINLLGMAYSPFRLMNLVIFMGYNVDTYAVSLWGKIHRDCKDPIFVGFSGLMLDFLTDRQPVFIGVSLFLA